MSRRTKARLAVIAPTALLAAFAGLLAFPTAALADMGLGPGLMNGAPGDAAVIGTALVVYGCGVLLIVVLALLVLRRIARAARKDAQGRDEEAPR